MLALPCAPKINRQSEIPSFIGYGPRLTSTLRVGLGNQWQNGPLGPLRVPLGHMPIGVTQICQVLMQVTSARPVAHRNKGEATPSHRELAPQGVVREPRSEGDLQPLRK